MFGWSAAAEAGSANTFATQQTPSSISVGKSHKIFAQTKCLVGQRQQKPEQLEKTAKCPRIFACDSAVGVYLLYTGWFFRLRLRPAVEY